MANKNIAGDQSGYKEAVIDHQKDPFYPRWWPERLEQIRKIKKPTGIFLDDMSDWMGDYWPEEWTKMELQVMRDCPQHRIYTLTKQPAQLSNFSPFPDNCYVGVTACNWEMALAAFWELQDVKASVKYISFEPLLDSVGHRELEGWLSRASINWLIIGACTGTKRDMEELCKRYPDLTPMSWGKRWTAQPPIKWLQEIVEAADKAGIPVFLKNNIRPLLIPEDCSKPNYLTEDIFWASEKAQLRQEIPEAR